MKKSLLLILAALVMLLCAGCSDSGQADDSLTPEKTCEVKLTFAIGLNARLSTRAGRTLESSDDWQKVNSMRVYLFHSTTESGTYTYYRPMLDGVVKDYLYVSDFEKTSVWGDDETTFEEHIYITSTLELATGWYKFLAIGRDDINGDNDSGATWTFTTLTEGATTLESLTATVTSTSLACNELFVNYDDISPLYMDGVNPALYKTIMLRRAVAGVLMYVENVPANIGGTDVKSIGIIRRKHTWAVSLISPTLAPPTATGSVSTPIAADGATLVGVTPAATDYVLQYDLSSATIVNGYFVNTNPTNTVHPNSIYKGAFVTPQEAATADCTLEMVLCDAAGTVLRSRNVKLVKSNGTDVDASLNYLYPIVANNIYQLGQRNIKDNIDEPIDLGDLPDDVIIVHGSWQADVDIDM